MQIKALHHSTKKGGRDLDCSLGFGYCRVNSMKLLAIETSTENCSAALLVDNEVFAINEIAPQKHAELILPMCDRVREHFGVEQNELDGIVYGRGPGSFTGVRIAASTAQGLAFGLEIPCAGVVSLEALAMQSLIGTDEQYAIGAIDARMGEVYCAVYEKTGDYPKALLEPCVLPPEVAVEKIFQTLGARSAYAGGSGVDLLHKAGLNPNVLKRSSFPDAEMVALLGKKLFEQGKVVDCAEALPLYVRDDVAWKKVSDQKKQI